ncbi:transposase family protein, partial [Streptomyces sp. NPDC058442]|uniref:transposase family protein n=1 Tax=Streptomyces sp. NPDC058442 TaxID=3346503 RepID=UPI00365EED93
LVDALNRFAATLGIPTLTDLGYENAADGFRHPYKKPKGGELTEEQRTFNAVIRGIHGVAERANALLKVTFKALRRVSLDPAAITRIARAALVLLQLEHGRTT